MLTPARAAISRVEAPGNPFAANTSSAAARMRPLVDPGASRACSSADLTTRTGDSIDRPSPRTAAFPDCQPPVRCGRCRPRTGSVHDLLPHREANDLGRVVEIELLHDVLAVRLDRVDAHRQDGGDLLVRLSLGDQLEDLALTVGQQREVVLDVLAAGVAEISLEQDLRDGRAEERAAAPDRLDRLQQVEVLGVL